MSHFLLIDDNKADLEYTKRIILKVRPGTIVTSCQTVKEAKEVLQQFDIDLIFTDMIMPGESFTGVFDAMRYYVPVVMLSGMSPQAPMIRATLLHYPRLYIEKPLTEEYLRDALEFVYRIPVRTRED